MQYVYVLVSKPSDLYYEQALMSVFSLRHYEPDASVIFLTDNKTSATFTGNRSSYLQYVSKTIIVDYDEAVSNVERSRLLKTSITEYVEGPFLFIDCDTIICAPLGIIESCSADIGAVLDGHVALSEHIHQKHFYALAKKLKFVSFSKTGINVNSGVIYCKNNENAKKTFKKWNELWKYCKYIKKDHHDQPAFNEAVYTIDAKFKLLPGEWNCQPSHGGLAFLKDARIIHYYSSEFSGKNYISYYKLGDPTIQNLIKESGDIPEDVKQMILAPKFQFNKVHLINDARIVSIMQSPLVFALADIKAHMPWLFAFQECIVGGIRQFVKKLLFRNDSWRC